MFWILASVGGALGFRMNAAMYYVYGVLLIVYVKLENSSSLLAMACITAVFFTLVWAKVPQWLPHWVPKAKLGLPPSFCQFCDVLGQLCN